MSKQITQTIQHCNRYTHHYNPKMGSSIAFAFGKGKKEQSLMQTFFKILIKPGAIKEVKKFSFSTEEKYFKIKLRFKNPYGEKEEVCENVNNYTNIRIILTFYTRRRKL